MKIKEKILIFKDVVVVVALIVICVLFFLEKEENKIYEINLRISVGMDKEEVEQVLGEPFMVVRKEDSYQLGSHNKVYPYYQSKQNYENNQKGKIPQIVDIKISNMVYDYCYKKKSTFFRNREIHLYVFFDNNNRVEKIFWGDKTKIPFWAKLD